ATPLDRIDGDSTPPPYKSNLFYQRQAPVFIISRVVVISMVIRASVLVLFCSIKHVTYIEAYQMKADEKQGKLIKFHHQQSGEHTLNFKPDALL
ncbi:MAG: hypothetical protein ACI94O_002017, partial [Octadecabacter sp.]